MTGIARSDKQQELMRIVLQAADAGEFLNVTQIHQRLVAYKCAYGSVRCSMRFLVEHGVLIREKIGSSSVMKPTPEAYRLFRQR